MEQYQDKRKKYIQSLGNGRKSVAIIIAAVIVFAIVIIVCSAWNAISMERTSRENTREYIGQVTEQIAYTIDTDVDDKKSMLESVSSSVTMFIEDKLYSTARRSYIEDYLKKMCESCNFEFIFLRRSGEKDIAVGDIPSELMSKLSDDSESYDALEAMGRAIDEEKCLAYIEDGSIVYAMPIYSNGELAGALCAGGSSESLEKMVAVEIYRSKSNYCILNRDGKVLVMSDDGSFDKLNEKLSSDSTSMQQISQELKAAVFNGETGTLKINLSGDLYYLSYVPLTGENWRMLTLMPGNIFSGIYTTYMLRALLCAIGAAVVFLLLLGLLVSNYGRKRKKLERLAFTDEITCGYNETEFLLRYARLRRSGDVMGYSIVLLNIHDFKLINEMCGKSEGDGILKHVYKIISEELKGINSEFAARTETDHFFLCMRERTAAGIQKRIDSIVEKINDSEYIEKLGFKIEFRQGACLVDSKETQGSILQERARIAAKNQDYGSLNRCVMFEPEMENKIRQDHTLDLMADESMKNHDFKVYFQPKVNMRTGSVKGAEALVRWQHPQRGLISPAEFIPVLEQTGRIQKLDCYVYEEVCRWLSERERAGKKMFPVSVNLSRTHFWKENFLDEYVAIADKYNVNRDYVEFELTETVFMEDAKIQRVKEGIRKMHEYGFSCSVDDFGVGYSSLSLINEMDFDILKFDRSFFMNLNDKKSQRIVKCLVDMAKELNLGMIIEGIETQEQIDFLKTMQCDVVQGYYYSRPLPEDDFNNWVENFENQKSA